MTRASIPRQGRKPVHDSVRHHRDWLALVEVTGPFLSLPVLRSTWPALDPVEPAERDELRREHGRWRDAPDAEQQAWISWLLRDLLGWGGEYRSVDQGGGGLETLAVEVPEHDTVLTPSFALVDPASDGEQVKPDTVRLLGLVTEPGVGPTGRIPGSAWAATPVDRLAQLCRHHGVELGLATDGRRWALVRAPRGGVTTTAVFDAVAWAEAAERDVVRAFRSLLGRRRFFGVPEEERLPALLTASEAAQEDITEALGVQVRQAVELLVAAIGRADVRERENGGAGLEQVSAHEVYRGAVSVMMRVVFLLFAEERGLLPSDNDLYARAYSAGTLCGELEQHARESSEDELETRYEAWHRLLALFTAVHDGIDHPRLRMHAHDGSLFDPEAYPWLPRTVDDRTVLHMLRAVQYVWIGTGKNRERRTLSFRQLDVEQIGYVYEGLLSFEGFRADGPVVGVIGKPGLEEEIPLAELEDLATRFRGRPLLAAELAERYKSSGIGTSKALERKLAPLDPTAHEEARKKLLAVTGGDYPLAERLLAFAGIIRADLRGLPVVILPGALYVTESALRRNTGTHYTPRKLATEVVEHALEPLLYHVGPLQTADRTQWKHRTAKELLELKVADIAMGSAAFLVAAARYLGAALLDARVREGTVAPPVQDGPVSPDADEDPLVVDARREVIEHCLYGVDINPMAVEMAKLSLWLVSMDSRRPFTFLDDRLVAGDSLLGITNTEQLEYLHLDPKKAREWNKDALDWTPDVRGIIARAAELRREIAAIELGDDPLAALDTKRALLEQVKIETAQLRLFADLTVGAALAGSQKNTGARDPNMRGAIAADVRISREGLYLETLTLAQHIAAGEGEAGARAKVRRWLETDALPGVFSREPLHWPLAFPEAFEGGGFDAVIGNPPFLGGKKISGASGSAYREHLVEAVSGGVKGNADLVAYFVLRAHRLANAGGLTGLIATNTLAQGDTREVGLDQLVAEGVRIKRSVKSEPWPSRSAMLEYCAVWTTRMQMGPEAECVANGAAVAAINSSLEAVTRSSGNAYRLASSQGRAFIGSFVNGIGFVVDAETYALMVSREPASKDVVFRFLNGQDLNSTAGAAATRWIINYGNSSYDFAAGYPVVIDHITRHVKPRRDKLPDYKKRVRDNWWKYEHQARPLYEAISKLDRAIAITLVSKTVMPAMVPTGQVFSHALGVFATDDTAMLALLSSAPHYWWAVARASSMKADLRYTPSDVFETLPLPDLTPELRELGDRLDTTRRPLMLARQTGLTKTYNLVFDPTVHDPDIVELREIHQAIDEATVRAYGWDDLLDQLDHGFHPAGRDKRFTIGPAAQREILDRLLELNHARYAEEVAKGLHAKKGRKPAGQEGLY